MRYAKIANYDVANGPGLRTTLFVQGCPHHCPGCFNPDTWDFDGGMEFTKEVKEEFFAKALKPGIRGFSILGGEPLAQGTDMLSLVQEIKDRFPDKDLWIWTGWTYENLNNLQKTIVSYADVLVDGPFIEDEKDISLVYKGSKNQRVIDIDALYKTGEIQEWRNSHD